MPDDYNSRPLRPCPHVMDHRAAPLPPPSIRPDSPLKLHASLPSSAKAFTGYGDGYVEVNAIRYEHSIVVTPDREVETWPVARFDDLGSEHFAMAAALEPELVVFGSGRKLRFPHPRLLAPLSARGVGVETMDVQAACRTYNILMAEGRKVALALIFDAADTTGA